MTVRGILAAVVLLCVPTMISAQTAVTKLKPTETVRVTWPAPIVAPDTLDAPEGYRVEAVQPTSTGVVIRSWQVADVSARSYTLPMTEVPSGLFSLTVKPYNDFGVAAPTNFIGPFGRATAPKSLTAVSGSVVAGVP